MANFDEGKFQTWYAERAKKAGLSPNPDDPRHHYDYRAAYTAGAEPEIANDGQYHWPSKFKADDHPNRFINGVDTKVADPDEQGDPIVSFFKSLIGGDSAPKSSTPNPVALSPFAGLVAPDKRPVAPRLDPAQVPSPFAGLAPNPLLKAREDATKKAQQRLTDTGIVSQKYPFPIGPTPTNLGGPANRRTANRMGIAEIIPPALQKSMNPTQTDKMQPGNAVRIPWDNRVEPGALGYFDHVANTISVRNPESTPIPGVVDSSDLFSTTLANEVTLPHEAGHAMWELGAIPEQVKSQWTHIHNQRAEAVRVADSKERAAREAYDWAMDDFWAKHPDYDPDLPPKIRRQMESTPEGAKLLEAENEYKGFKEDAESERADTPDFILKYLDDPSHSFAAGVGEFVGTPEFLEQTYPPIYKWMRSVMGREYKMRDAAEAASPAAQVPFYWGSQ